MQDLGVFHSLGALWLRVLNELEPKGAEGVYTDNTGESAVVKELLYLTAEVQDAALPDAIIESIRCRRNMIGWSAISPCRRKCRSCIMRTPNSKGNCGEGRHSLRKADFDRKVGALLFARQRKGAGDYRQGALSATVV